MELINQRKTGSQPQEKEKEKEKEKYEKQTKPILRLGPRPLRPGPSKKMHRLMVVTSSINCY